MAGRLARYLEEAVKAHMRQSAGGGADTPPGWAISLAETLADALTRGAENGIAVLPAQALADVTTRVDQASIAVTGEAWVGGDRPALERTMAELIAGARQELLVTAYSVTPGSERIWQEIERSLATGIRVTIVVDGFDHQTPEARLLLERLVRSHRTTLAVYDFARGDDTFGLHAKVLVADRRLALVGSANLSHRGLVAAHEMAMLAEGPVAARVAGAIDALVRSRLVSRVTAGTLQLPRP